MVITGRNLAPSMNSNQVFVGDSLCEITAISNTEVTCTVPRYEGDEALPLDAEVVVTGRLVEESSCTGSCIFTYTDVSGDAIVLPSSLVAQNGQEITIQAEAGTDLTGATVTVNSVECPLLA